MPAIYQGPGCFIGGKWLGASELPTTDVRWTTSVNPANLDAGPVAEYAWSLDCVESAVQAAQGAFPAWRALEQGRHEEIMRAAQQGLRDRKSELAQAISLEMGRPIGQCPAEVDAMIRKFDVTLPDAAELLKLRPAPHELAKGISVRGEPWGVTAVIAPNNYPGHLTGGMVIPALATRNTVVLKPASSTPTIWRLICEIFEAAGLPAGVLNYIPGNWRVGEALAKHPNVDNLIFTGSVEVGHELKIAAASTHKQMKLEMGGQGVALVLEDADIEKAVAAIIRGATFNAQQNCNGTRGVFCTQETADRLLEALVAKMAQVKVGDPTTDVEMGPMATDPQGSYQKNLGTMLARGCEVVYQYPLPEGLPRGYYVGPTIYKRPTHTFVPRDTLEIFGPALAFTVFEDAEEAIVAMNRIHMRLSCAVHGQDMDRVRAVANQLRWGQVNLNLPTIGGSSFVGFGGLGEAVFGGFGAREMTSHTVATVSINT